MMEIECDMISSWFTLNSGFKVYGRCPGCFSPNISYQKMRRSGLTGISPGTTGLTPVCLDCGKGLPSHLNKDKKAVTMERQTKRAY